MDAPEHVVNRWRRYGNDRLYVETPGGAKVGFWDLTTDTGHPEDSTQRASLTAAVQGWQASQAAGVPATLEPAVGRPWVDLASNRPGEQTREQARSARGAAPVRTLLARVLGVHTDERAWRIGADGEEKVAAHLVTVAKKDPRWRFLHAIPVGNRGSDIDHLIIGPGGVFTANAKHHPRAKIWVGGNTFIVNGRKVRYIPNARHEAERAAKLLTADCGFPVHVHGLIVTVNADDVVIKSQPDGVHVTSGHNLATWLLRHGDVLTARQLDAVYAVARRSTTWQP